MKTFDGDFYKFLNKLKNGEHFSLSRWGDGELRILEDIPIDLRNKGNGEFRFDPNISEYDEVKRILNDSFTYKSNEYYIGIACPCCQGVEKFIHMKQKSGQDEDHLTWANIFVNANYRKTLTEFIPELNKHNVNLVINNNSKINGLPFEPHEVWYVGTDAWYANYDVCDKIIEYIIKYNVKNEIFLFAAGPLANILTYKLSLCSAENTYIDIGSILDPYLQLLLTRRYHLGVLEVLNKVCVW